MKKLTTLAAAMMLVTSGFAVADSQSTVNSQDNALDKMQRVDGSKMANVFVSPDASVAGYNKVMITDVQVEFVKNYMRNYNRKSTMRLTSNDLNRMSDKIAEEFTEIFTQVMSENGIQVVDELGEGVLVLKPALADVYVDSPTTSHAGYAKTWGKTSMAVTMYAEVYNSESGELMVLATDRQEAPESIFFSRQNESRNKFDGGAIIKRWAQNFVDALQAPTA